MASRDIHDLDPKLQVLAQEFLDQCAAQGLSVFLDQTYRSAAEQNILYAQGRTTPGNIVTHAEGGQSAHNCVDPVTGTPAARAFDIAINLADGSGLDWNATGPQWQAAIQVGRALGLEAGADWPVHIRDNPHFELPNWQSA